MERICANCGAKSNDDTQFCTKCGTPYPTPEEERRRIANKYLIQQPQVRNTSARVRRSARKSVSFLQLLSWFISIIIFCFIGYFVYIFWTAIQPTPIVNQSSTPIMISASQLISEYTNNEVAADQKYQNYNLEISGVVQSISKNLFNDPYIVIAPNTQTFNGIQCSFNQDQEGGLATLNTGQNITVEGIGNGYMLNSVMVNNCSIVQNNSVSQ